MLLNGAILQRQSQLRFFAGLGNNYNLMVSVEDPKTEIQNGVDEPVLFPGSERPAGC